MASGISGTNHWDNGRKKTKASLRDLLHLAHFSLLNRTRSKTFSLVHTWYPDASRVLMLQAQGG